ncbi:glutamate--tRNA ligase [Azospirillum baldaniorum]|uniref:Glutamate--tRNA ligase n=1 Tax=Azospirillum baldaniorum TaxID=1064539 RepID=A0A9P1JQM6_9PROT|nr:glutamate--tRNA ligase [Azospirillum baldaniorum]AWJ90048.1 glutamate--tRNA ligase [Azospirillum baldaniorum]TWA67498.1 glutamyl-tRNA synthetase [Azospirillum baldaniorum]TWA77412.1 glutamyl-tRNA synthetase [Azospirillum brasilense]CCC97910.1 glutamyl-tRNA synthetase [Azospirillum baldaniorum]
MTVVTRFAPSPTGFLHIGGARTALFNWLYARRNGGTYLLRIEDTDRQRSTDAAVDAILDGLSWLGLDWDGDAVSQFARKDRHAEVAQQMLAAGRAYYCYASPEELEEMRAAQKAAGQPVRYDGRWRDRDPSEAPAGVKPVIRLKAPQEGETVLKDRVQGEVTVQNAQLDDLILLRADGTPTYLLAVVVDDHDMGVTHVIRGDDHLTNTFRQIQIYNAMGWDLPEFGHIPLIHGPDGAKLSKRHGALGVDAYRDMGYLPEAIRNYLLRLGWGHGDDEIISTEQAVEWFNLEGIGRSPSRFDFAKLENLNAHYMRQADDARLVGLATPRLEAELGRALTESERDLLTRAMNGLKQRARTVVDLAQSARFYLAARPLAMDEKAAALLDEKGRGILTDLAARFEAEADFTAAALEGLVRAFAEERGEKLGKIAQPLRAALTGSTVSPPIFEVAEILGRAETLARMKDAATAARG